MNSEEWSKLKEILYGRTWGCPVDEARILSNLAIACGEMAVWAEEREKENHQVKHFGDVTVVVDDDGNSSVLDAANLPPFPEARVDIAPPQRCLRCGNVIMACDCRGFKEDQ